MTPFRQDRSGKCTRLQRPFTSPLARVETACGAGGRNRNFPARQVSDRQCPEQHEQGRKQSNPGDEVQNRACSPGSTLEVDAAHLRLHVNSLQ
jgi:hypothetical protein